MSVNPLTFMQHIDLLISLHNSHSIRLRDQLAYHLSKTVRDDYTYIIKHSGVAIAEVSARYTLIRTMHTLGML